MESKYILLGINLIITAVIISIISVSSGQYSLLGVSSSILIFGFTSLAVGFSYREPSIDFLIYYVDFIRRNFIRIIEDLDLLDHKLYVFPSDKYSYFVLAKGDISDFSPKSFIGYSNDGQYIVLKVDRIVTPSENEIDPEVYLRSKIVDSFMLASSIYLSREDNLYRIIVSSVDERVVKNLDRPLCPLSLLVSQIVAESIKKNVKVVEERFEEDNLNIVLEVF